MNHKITKVVTPTGELRYEIRAWGLQRGEVKRRAKTKDEALNLIQDLYRLDKLIDPHNPLFQTELEFWLKTKATKFAPGWMKNIRAYIEELDHSLGGLTISEINKTKILEIEHWLLAKGNKQKTVNSKIGFILSVLNHSVKMDRIPGHKLLGFRMTKPERKESLFWTREEAMNFLQWADKKYEGSPDRWVYAVYLLALNSGARAGEIWALRWKDLLPKEGVFQIREQLNMVSKTFTQTKGKEQRFAPLPDSLYKELCRISSKRDPDELIFKRDNKIIDHRGFIVYWKRDLRHSRSKVIPFHSLRHTAGTLMTASGVSVRVVQQVLGHKDIQTTMRYVHALRSSIRTVSDSFELSPVNSMATLKK